MSTDIETERGTTEPGREAGGPRYAVLFRTHFWDAFAQRQFDRIRARAPSADVFVLADETRGKLRGVGADRVVGVTDEEILAAGFVAAGEGSLQWYSGDVPLYMFHRQHPGYDLYLQVEYDVNVHVDLDRLAARLHADRVDFLGSTNLQSIEDWHWLPSCRDAYRPDEVRHQLICLSAFSNRALATLSERRLAHAASFRAGEMKSWPLCEGFIASEAVRQGLNVAELSRYGDIGAYDWWPPFLESDLGRLQKHAFVHPVLDPPRYVPSLFKKSEGVRLLLLPTSWLHRKLQRLGPVGYVRSLAGRQFRGELRAALTRLVRRPAPAGR